jgi:hypothetical protein
MPFREISSRARTLRGQGEVGTQHVETDRIDRWDFPPQTVKLDDGTPVLRVHAGALLLYTRPDWGDRRPIAAKTFSALVQTAGWAGENAGFDIFFWDAAAELMETWSITGITIPVGNDKEPFQVGAAALADVGMLSRIAAVTYSVGGGLWYAQ